MRPTRFQATVAVHLLLLRDEHVLLLRRHNTGYEDGNYSLIAGHLDGNETATAAMVREAFEEARIRVAPADLRFVHVMHRKEAAAADERIDLFFAATRWAGEPEIGEPDKCDELRWAALDALPSNMVPYVRAALGHIGQQRAYAEFWPAPEEAPARERSGGRDEPASDASAAMLDRESVITRTAAFVRERLSGEASGHDWWHAHRVWRTALAIGAAEGVDLFVVQLAALLHDIADAKFHDGDEEIGPRTAAIWLRSIGVDEPAVAQVTGIIRDISFKGAGVAPPLLTREGMVVQDADRLDALGAIGIARAFAYGGFRGQILHDPEITPVLHATVDAYRSHQGSTLNHFSEKLFLLKDRMHTESGRRLATERHRVMERFVREFLAEWDGLA